MIYESVITQLNNYKRLNNDGNGIELKEVPVVAKEYLDISAGDNIKFIGIEFDVTNSDYDAQTAPDYQTMNIQQLTEYTGYGTGNPNIEKINAYYGNVNKINGYTPYLQKFKFKYTVNGIEEDCNCAMLVVAPLDLSNYETTYGKNIHNIVIDVTDAINPVPEEEPPIGHGIVPTPFSIWSTWGYIGTHTEIRLKKTINGEDYYTEPFNIALSWTDAAS